MYLKLSNSRLGLNNQYFSLYSTPLFLKIERIHEFELALRGVIISDEDPQFINPPTLFMNKEVRHHTESTIQILLNRVLFLTYVQRLGKSLDEVTLDDINTFLANKLNSETKRCYIKAIRLLGKVNATYHPKFYEVTKQVKYPKVRIKLPQLPSRKDVELLIENARQPYKAIIVLLYEDSLRRCEALNLRYGDVKDWDVGYKITVRFSKVSLGVYSLSSILIF